MHVNDWSCLSIFLLSFTLCEGKKKIQTESNTCGHSFYMTRPFQVEARSVDQYILLLKKKNLPHLGFHKLLVSTRECVKS